MEIESGFLWTLLSEARENPAQPAGDGIKNLSSNERSRSACQV